MNLRDGYFELKLHFYSIEVLNDSSIQNLSVVQKALTVPELAPYAESGES